MDARREAVARMLHDASPTPEIHAATHWKGLNPSYRAHWYEMADALLAWHDAETQVMCVTHGASEAPIVCEKCVNAQFARLDAEARALREALAELVDQVERDVPAHRCPGYDCATCGRPSTMRVRALLTPTPGAVRGCTTCRERWAKQGWEGHCPHSLPTPGAGKP